MVLYRSFEEREGKRKKEIDERVRLDCWPDGRVRLVRSFVSLLIFFFFFHIFHLAGGPFWKMLTHVLFLRGVGSNR